jgi:hypothetical protein
MFTECPRLACISYKLNTRLIVRMSNVKTIPMVPILKDLRV